jgi:hypothetical protein
MLSAVVLTSGGGGSDFIHAILVLIIVGVILGALIWLVSIAPFIPDLFKKVITWVIYFCAFIIAVNFLLGLVGHSFIAW